MINKFKKLLALLLSFALTFGAVPITVAASPSGLPVGDYIVNFAAGDFPFMYEAEVGDTLVFSQYVRVTAGGGFNMEGAIAPLVDLPPIDIVPEEEPVFEEYGEGDYEEEYEDTYGYEPEYDEYENGYGYEADYDDYENGDSGYVGGSDYGYAPYVADDYSPASDYTPATDYDEVSVGDCESPTDEPENSVTLVWYLNDAPRTDKGTTLIREDMGNMDMPVRVELAFDEVSAADMGVWTLRAYSYGEWIESEYALFLVVGEFEPLAEIAPLNAAIDPVYGSTWSFLANTTDGSGSYGGGTWEWVQATRTLTLTDIAFSTNANPALLFHGNTTVVLYGNNSITSTATATFADGIEIPGILTIQGDGELTVQAGTASNESTGIWAAGLVVNSGTLNALGGTTTSLPGQGRSTGYSGGNIIINGGTFNAASGDAPNGGGRIAVTSIGGGIVTINGGSGSFQGGSHAMQLNQPITGGSFLGWDGSAYTLPVEFHQTGITYFFVEQGTTTPLARVSFDTLTLSRTISFPNDNAGISRTYGDPAFTHTLTFDPPNSNVDTITWVSSNTAVATVDANGQITIAGVGTTSITADIEATAAHTAATASFDLTVNRANQNALTITPPGTLTTDDTSIQLVSTGGSGNGVVTFTRTAGTDAVATVSSTGLVTIMGEGQITVVATNDGGANHNPITSAPLVITIAAANGPSETVVTPPTGGGNQDGGNGGDSGSDNGDNQNQAVNNQTRNQQTPRTQNQAQQQETLDIPNNIPAIGSADGEIGGMVNIPVTVDAETGEVTIEISNTAVNALITYAESQAQESDDPDAQLAVTIDLSEIEEAATVVFDVNAAEAFAEADVTVTLAFNGAEITLDPNKLAAFADLEVDGETPINVALEVTPNENFLTITVNITVGDEVIQQTAVPFTIATSLDTFDLTGLNTYRIVAVFGNPTILGGLYDTETGLFTLQSRTTGEIDILYIEMLKRLTMQVGSAVVHDLAGNAPTQVMDVLPVVVDGRTLIPVRFVAEALGADVDWNSQTSEVTLTLNNQTLTFAIGETAPGMDVPAIVIDERTMLPLRFVSEFLGALVEWDSETQNIGIIKDSAMALREESEDE